MSIQTQSIQAQILRLKNAKADILSAIVEKGVTVPAGVLLDEVADLIRSILLNADNYLSVELDDGISGYLSIELDGETTDGTDPTYYLTIRFN